MSDHASDNLIQSDAGIENTDAGNVGTLPNPSAVERAGVDPKATTCPKCGMSENWGMNSWCPGCGYYPSLGSDADAVANMEGIHQSFEDVNEEMPSIPIWAVVLSVGVLAVIGMSIAARVTISNSAGARTAWSLTQLGSGFIVLLLMQVLAGVCASFRSSDFSPADILLKPIEVWKSNVRKLPQGAWMFQLMSWSLTAILGAIVIVGSIPYSAMFDDWGVEKREKPNLLQAVVSQARNAKEKEDGADNLEDAMNDFVGEAEGGAGLEELEEEGLIEEREGADCIIVGYMKGADGQYQKILLAAMVGSELKYVGSIQFENIPMTTQKELSERMIHYRQKRPFVKTSFVGATWLKPVLMCRVDYEKLSKNGEMEDLKFVESLADVR